MRVHPGVFAVALPLLAAALLAGCANDSPQPSRPFVAVERPGEPRPCPQRRGDDDVRQFDARTLLGLSEAEAGSEAARHDCELRVVERDGRAFDITGDLQFNRIDVAVRDGIVVALPEQGWTSYAPLPSR